MSTKSRPWTPEDVKSFVNLKERIGPTAESPASLSSLASLLALKPLTPKLVLAEGDFETIEDAWRAREKHPIYKWLDKNEHFREARLTLKRRQLNARGKLKAPTAEFIFMRVIVDSADFYFRLQSTSSKGRARGAIKALRTSADKHAGKLLKQFCEGVGLPSYQKQKQLEELLQELQIFLRSKHRKDYSGRGVADSHFLEYLALQLNRALGLHSPKIIQDIGQMLGISRDSKACARYARRAAELLASREK